MRTRILRLLAVLTLLTAVEAGIHPSPVKADNCRAIYCCPNNQLCAIQCGPLYIDFACL